MAPAFSSTRQVAAFALLLAVLLVLPMFGAAIGWRDRRDVYAATPWECGPFTWIQRQVFTETKDVDIAILGSSKLWAAIDTPYLEKKLSEHLGRDAEVFTLGWPWSGFDGLYVIARDLLEHRRVHTLCVYDEGQGRGLHFNSWRWFRIGENSEPVTEVSWLTQARFYGGAVLSMPRNLLSLARPNLVEDTELDRPTHWTKTWRALHFAKQRGAFTVPLAYNHKPDYVPFHPEGNATPADALIYSAETRSRFDFIGPELSTYQLHFARKLAGLCKNHGTQLVFLHVPSLPERERTVVSERVLWPEVLGAPAEVTGIPPTSMFAGIPREDVSKLFLDDGHLNQSGEEMFTRLITPAFFKLYDSYSNRH
jgi:hypothetical protein